MEIQHNESQVFCRIPTQDKGIITKFKVATKIRPYFRSWEFCHSWLRVLFVLPNNNPSVITCRFIDMLAGGEEDKYLIWDSDEREEDDIVPAYKFYKSTYDTSFKNYNVVNCKYEVSETGLFMPNEVRFSVPSVLKGRIMDFTLKKEIYQTVMVRIMADKTDGV